MPAPAPPTFLHFCVPLTDQFSYVSVDCSARVYMAEARGGSQVGVEHPQAILPAGPVHDVTLKRDAVVRHHRAVRGHSH